MGRRGGLQLRQWCHFRKGLQWEQVAPLVQPAEAGQVILVRYVAEALNALSFEALRRRVVRERGGRVERLCCGWRERGGGRGERNR